MILTPGEVLARGFRAYSGLRNDHDGELNDRDVALFKKIYGSSPTVIAMIWSFIVEADEEEFKSKDLSEKGFKQFLIAMHFLWAYPKNAEIMEWESIGFKERSCGDPSH